MRSTTRTPLARRLPAETLYDAVHTATGSRPRLPGVPEGFLASQLPDSGVELADGFLNLFGAPPAKALASANARPA